MGLKQTFLRPVARLAGMHAAAQTRKFLAAHERTEEVQDRLLARLLAAAEGSEFWRDHGLGRVGCYSDFAAAVPVGDYEARRPYLRRVFEGRTSAMFAPDQRVLMFAVTSGTTGEPKYIPVTGQFLSDYRRGWNIFGVRVLRDHPSGWLRKIVTITSTARETTSPMGLPCGSVSGMLAASQKWVVRKMYPVPRAVGEISDAASKYYAIIRSAIAHDVGIVTVANPSSLVKLAEFARDHAERIIRDVHDGTLSPPGDQPVEASAGLRFRRDRAGARRLEAILSRHGELLPKHFWNLSCLTTWTGGTVALYLPRVRRLYGDVPVRDIGLLASEGRMSIPLTDGTAAGVADITSNFLEFIPAEQIESADPDVLRAHEVEPGREYFVVMSNWAGLWRYHIDDRVRVTGRLRHSPIIEFLSRGVHTSSITGEKLTEHQVVHAMRRAARGDGSVEVFTLQGHFADVPYYELCLEDGGAVGPAAADRLDEALRELNVEYHAKRASGRLGAIQAKLCRPGHFAADESEQIAFRRGRAEQYKHRYLLSDVIEDTDSSDAGG